jgi:hypothetical protein
VKGIEMDWQQETDTHELEQMEASELWRVRYGNQWARVKICSIDEEITLVVGSDDFGQYVSMPVVDVQEGKAFAEATIRGTLGEDE